MKFFPALMILLFCVPAAAQEDIPVARLDEPARVRVINADPALENIPVFLGDAVYPEAAPWHAGTYMAVPEGKLVVSRQDKTQDFEVTGRAFYTLVMGEEIVLLPDSKPEIPAKAHVIVYNLTDIPVQLRANAGKKKLLEIPAGVNASTDLNAIPITLSIHAKDVEAARIKRKTLKKGDNIAIVVHKHEKALQAALDATTAE